MQTVYQKGFWVKERNRDIFVVIDWHPNALHNFDRKCPFRVCIQIDNSNKKGTEFYAPEAYRTYQCNSINQCFFKMKQYLKFFMNSDVYNLVKNIK